MDPNIATKPSIFDLVACDNLKSGLREAFRYLLNHVGVSLRISDIEINQDDLVLLIDSLIEFFHLKAYNASYAENLFGLVRSSPNPESTLTKENAKLRSVLPSLVCLCFIPYFKHKLDRYFQDMYLKDSRTSNELEWIEYYKTFTKLQTILDLICTVRYASGKSDHHNAINTLLKLSISNQSDLQAETTRCDDKTYNSDATINTDKLCKTMADLLGRCLTVGSYVIQFLDYWNTSTNSASLFDASLPIPDPPKQKDYPHSDERSANICLICLHVRQNECVLSNTGYVFCYKCIHRYVTTNGKCPITGLAANVNNIIQLFTIAPS